MKVDTLRFVCPRDGADLQSQRETLICKQCGGTWGPVDGSYRFFDLPKAPQKVQQSFHLHNDSLPRIQLSRWHHFLSNARSHFTNGFVHRRFSRDVPGYARVIDLGCGNGFMRGLLPNTVDYVGVDFDPELLRRAAHYNPAFYLQSLAESVPLADGQFDFVISTETLEHVPQPENLLREARRLLKPGGRLLLSAPNEYCWKYRVKGHHEQHASNFDKNSLQRLASEFFTVEHVDEVGFWFPLPTGRYSLQVGLPMPSSIATNFLLYGHK